MTDADHTFYTSFAVMTVLAIALIWDCLQYNRRNRMDK